MQPQHVRCGGHCDSCDLVHRLGLRTPLQDAIFALWVQGITCHELELAIQQDIRILCCGSVAPAGSVSIRKGLSSLGLSGCLQLLTEGLSGSSKPICCAHCMHQGGLEATQAGTDWYSSRKKKSMSSACAVGCPQMRKRRPSILPMIALVIDLEFVPSKKAKFWRQTGTPHRLHWTRALVLGGEESDVVDVAESLPSLSGCLWQPSASAAW